MVDVIEITIIIKEVSISNLAVANGTEMTDVVCYRIWQFYMLTCGYIIC